MYYACICDFEVWGCSQATHIALCKYCPEPCPMANIVIKEDDKSVQLHVCPHCQGPYDSSYRQVKLDPGVMNVLNENFHNGQSWVFSKHH